MRQHNKVVVITGAASGIGLGIAESFIAQGATVLALDINETLLEENASRLGEHYVPRVLDIGSIDSIEAFGEAVKTTYGRLDVLVNCAVAATPHALCDLSEVLFEKEINVGLRAPMFLVKTFAPLLEEASDGNVINIISVGAVTENPGFYLYDIYKAALMKFTRECVVDLPGIRHNNVLPGLIETPILTGFKDQLEQIRMVCAERTSAGRLGEPADIANAVTFLASENSSYITGTDIIVDGGLTIGSNSIH